MISRASFFDLAAQLGRTWLVVVGSSLLGLVVGVAVEQTVHRPNGTPLPTIIALAILLAFVACGFALGLVVGFVLVRLQPRVTTADDVRRVTGLPVLAQLPPGVIDADDLLEGPASRRMRSALREAVMNIRSLAGGELPGRLVLARTEDVHDSSGVDGGLARALVESGFVSAVVHSDLESQLLVRPSTVDDSALEDPARPDASGYQRVPVADRVAAARPERRLGEAESYLASLGERYDVTVALAASNSLPVPLRGLAPIADAVIVVVRSNRTTVEDLLALHGELLGLGVEPLGVLMTGVAGRHRTALRRDWVPADVRDGVGAGVGAVGAGSSSPASISVVAPFGPASAPFGPTSAPFAPASALFGPASPPFGPASASASFGPSSASLASAVADPDAEFDFMPARDDFADLSRTPMRTGLSIADLAARAEAEAVASRTSGTSDLDHGRDHE